MTKQNGPRYSDSNKFNDLHDKLVLDLHHSPFDIVRHYYERPRRGHESQLLHFRQRSLNVYVEKAIDSFNIPDLFLRGEIDYGCVGLVVKKELLLRSGEENVKKWVIGCSGSSQDYSTSATILGTTYSIPPTNTLEEMDNRLRELGVLNENGTIGLRYSEESHFCHREIEFAMAVEVKSFVKSFGETMRQLQSYKDAMQKKHFGYNVEEIVTIASPDLRFQDEFENQGFHFYPMFLPDLEAEKTTDILSWKEEAQ